MRTITLAIAGLLLISGCSSDPEPIEPKKASQPSPTVTAPQMPAAVDEDTPDGAANFVAYWIDTSNYAALTGDTHQLRSISAPGCEGCRRYIDLYEKTYRAGGYYKGGERSVSKLTLEEGQGETYLSGDVKAEAGRFRSAKGSPEQESDPEVTRVEFAVSFDASQWKMTQIGRADQ